MKRQTFITTSGWYTTIEVLDNLATHDSLHKAQQTLLTLKSQQVKPNTHKTPETTHPYTILEPSSCLAEIERWIHLSCRAEDSPPHLPPASSATWQPEHHPHSQFNCRNLAPE